MVEVWNREWCRGSSSVRSCLPMKSTCNAPTSAVSMGISLLRGLGDFRTTARPLEPDIEAPGHQEHSGQHHLEAVIRLRPPRALEVHAEHASDQRLLGHPQRAMPDAGELPVGQGGVADHKLFERGGQRVYRLLQLHYLTREGMYLAHHVAGFSLHHLDLRSHQNLSRPVRPGRSRPGYPSPGWPGELPQRTLRCSPDPARKRYSRCSPSHYREDEGLKPITLLD